MTGKSDLKKRTKDFALSIIRMCSGLPKTVEGQIIGKQVFRSGTSVGAHYREGMRARSRAEFVSKIEVALQELEETAYWIELLEEAKISPLSQLNDIKVEIQELLAIFVTSVKTAKENAKR